ncbi:MAG: TAT-variant-translocated molybdopterin oxidoreductase [Planctomycetota bacterium]
MPQIDTESTGKEYWRSLDDLADTPEFQRFVAKEFPQLTPELVSTTSRRSFLKIMGASFALAGMAGATGCIRWPEEKIVPFAKRPADTVLGRPVMYATSMELGGVAQPVLAASMDGRPIKIEGNPEHPQSMGAATSYAQASVLDLYDPDRSRSILLEGQPVDGGWQNADFVAFLQSVRAAGSRVAVLAEASSSPSFARLRAKTGAARWYEYEPLSDDNERMGLQGAFGKPLRPQYSFDKAKVIVSFDGDFLLSHPASLRYSRDFAKGRVATGGAMNRLHVVEATHSLTGTNADHRYPVTASKIPATLGRLAIELNKLDSSLGLGPVAQIAAGCANEGPAAMADVAKDLLANRGESIVLAGPAQPAAVHALAHFINSALGNSKANGPVGYAETGDDVARPSHVDAIRQLVADLASGAVDTVMILGGNPVYNSPADVDLAAALQGKATLHLGYHVDETSQACRWHVPRAHYLEAWGDARSYDGTYTVSQPLILPMTYDRAKTPTEILSVLFEDKARSAEEIVKETFTAGGASDDAWQKVLHDGFAANTSWRIVHPRPTNGWTGGLASLVPSAGSGTHDVIFTQDYKVHDGRFANNGWLQELPDPVTKITWDNAALMGLATAKAMGVNSMDMIEVTVAGQTLELPAYVLPGIAQGTIAIALGYGRSTEAHPAGDPVFRRPAGLVSYNAQVVERLKVATGTGFNGYLIRTADSMNKGSARAAVAAGSGTYRIATTQDHHLIELEADVSFGDKKEDFSSPGEEIQRRQTDILARGTLAKFLEDPQHFVSSVKKRSDMPWDHHGHDDHSHDGHGDEHGHGGHGDGHGGHGGHGDEQNLSLWEEHEYKGHRWGMSIDLSTCTGCSACVVACQAENNIGVVGKDEVYRGREMHWIRIDRYFSGDVETPEVAHQPMNCQQCENAPCESVCPVAATVHSEEGLNDMVYNRCIGTRYCSNNCPFKVRRFNYFNNHRVVDDQQNLLSDQREFEKVAASGEFVGSEAMVYNSDVTIRHRGVMEKCTYCVQRIQNAKIDAKNEGRQLKDGDVVPACAQTCPTDAIVFGDLSDKNSRVAKFQHDNRAYKLLPEINVKPRNSYQAKLKNPMEQG